MKKIKDFAVTCLLLVLIIGCKDDKKLTAEIDDAEFASNTQNLECKDFHSGRFVIPADSVVSETFNVYRYNNKQEEIGEESRPSYSNLTWIDDCNYVLTFEPDRNDGSLKDVEMMINLAGGLEVEMTEIRGDTMYYVARVTLNDRLRETPGMMIKVGD